MARSMNDDLLDAIGDYLKSNGVKMTACEGEPTTYEEASSNKGTGSGKVLAGVIIDSDDYELDDDTDGRKITILEQLNITVDISGDADHVAIIDTSGSGKLLCVTTCNEQSLTAGNTVTFPAWDILVNNPVAPA